MEELDIGRKVWSKKVEGPPQAFGGKRDVGGKKNNNNE